MLYMLCSTVVGLHENSNPSQPYRIAMRVLSLSSCSQEYMDNFRLLKHVEEHGICEISSRKVDW